MFEWYRLKQVYIYLTFDRLIVVKQSKLVSALATYIEFKLCLENL